MREIWWIKTPLQRFSEHHNCIACDEARLKGNDKTPLRLKIMKSLDPLTIKGT